MWFTFWWSSAFVVQLSSACAGAPSLLCFSLSGHTVLWAEGYSPLSTMSRPAQPAASSSRHTASHIHTHTQPHTTQCTYTLTLSLSLFLRPLHTRTHSSAMTSAISARYSAWWISVLTKAHTHAYTHTHTHTPLPLPTHTHTHRTRTHFGHLGQNVSQGGVMLCENLS